MRWENVKLSEICEIYGGTTPSTSKIEYWDGDIVWLSPSDLPAIGKIFTASKSSRRITEKAVKESSLTILPKGSVVYSTRASIGKIAIAEVPLTTNQGFANFICKDKVYNKYLAFALKYYTRNIAKLGNSTTFAEVSRSSIKNFEIPLPPFDVQRTISEILERANDLCENDGLLVEKYQELLHASFNKIFIQYIAPQSYHQSLAEHVEINPRKSEIQYGGDTEVSFVPMAAVGENGEFDCSIKKSLSEVKQGFTYFKENDVLFAKITPCMENGKGAIAKGLENGIGFGSTEFHILRPNDQLTAEFIYSLLSQKWVRQFAESSMTGSAGQKRVPSDFFRRLKVNKPPIELQEKYAIVYSEIMEMKKIAEKTKLESENLFQSLLQKAFKGELVI